VQPEQKLSVIVRVEDGMVLVVKGEVFALRRHLDDLFANFDAKSLKKFPIM
jgi:hypothetical protein